ncbi:ABC transporter permease [Nonomuraea sp. C10]|uniref:ABC transporter permease n=1 Tax=Nonomuraea sp. C10 TaxID=2600577 RepID=UPI0011CD8E4A|nr:ABC transporter permease [Nonomuraea sp. C10]TXK40265.1 ABC transporter permease [Nonomuraea sp. C10]
MTRSDTIEAGRPEAAPKPVGAPAASGGLNPRLTRRLLITAIQVALLVAGLAAWEYFAGKPGEPHVLIDQYYVSKPSLIWEAMGLWVSQNLLWPSLWVTLQTTVIGFVLGALAGLVAGFVLGVSPFLAAVCQPFVDAIYAIPRLALVPLFMLWFGIGIGSKLALVISVVAFLVFYSTYAGVKDVDHLLVDKLRLMRASRLQVHLKATLPSAMTFIISGLSVSAPYALVVAVTAEMMSSNRGLGYLLVQSANQFDTAGTFAAIFVLMIVGIALMLLIRLMEMWLLRWKPKRPTGRA